MCATWSSSLSSMLGSNFLSFEVNIKNAELNQYGKLEFENVIWLSSWPARLIKPATNEKMTERSSHADVMHKIIVYLEYVDGYGIKVLR